MKALSLSNRPPRSNGSGTHLPSVSPFASFHYEMDRLLDDMFGGIGFTRGQSASTLPVEVQESDSEYRVAVDLPGVDIKDIDLSYADGLLTLKGQRKPAEGEALYSSRWSGEFERVIGIGTDVDENQIGAALTNGVLTVTLPKKPESRPRRIQIE